MVRLSQTVQKLQAFKKSKMADIHQKFDIRMNSGIVLSLQTNLGKIISSGSKVTGIDRIITMKILWAGEHRVLGFYSLGGQGSKG